jgi:hypothetical protein
MFSVPPKKGKIERRKFVLISNIFKKGNFNPIKNSCENPTL